MKPSLAFSILLVACSGDDAATHDAGSIDAGPIDAGPPAPGLIFVSDWSTAVGASMNAVFDQGRTPHWNSEACGIQPNLIEVVPAAGLGFPASMANVLQVSYNGENCADVISLDQWAAPARNESIYFRLYLRTSIPDSVGTPPMSSHHPIEPKPGACPFQWEFAVGPRSNGTWDLRYVTPADYPLNGFNVEGLAKNAAYRLEWALHRQVDGSYRADLRLYNAAEQLVADDVSFLASDVGTSLADADPAIAIDDECMRALLVGNNGPSGWDAVTLASGARMYYGGVAVGRSGWIGPYVASEAVAP